MTSKKKKEIKKEPPAVIEPTYTYEDILASKRYRSNRDVLAVVLDPAKEYSSRMIEDAIKAFHSKPVEEAINK